MSIEKRECESGSWQTQLERKLMSDSQKTSNVKIYDRPERKGPSPILLALGLILLLVLGFMAYKFATRSSDAPAADGATGAGRASSSSATRPASSRP